jgi:hypothetical protein
MVKNMICCVMGAQMSLVSKELRLISAVYNVDWLGAFRRKSGCRHIDDGDPRFVDDISFCGLAGILMDASAVSGNQVVQGTENSK